MECRAISERAIRDSVISDFVMDREKPRREGVGQVGCILCVMLAVLASTGVCGAEQLRTDSTACPGAQIQTPQLNVQPIQSPIDSTMERLRQLENIAGFDIARLSAAGRNLFSLADRWPVLRERLIRGAATSAEPDNRSPRVGADAADSAANLRQSRYSGFTQSETASAWCGNEVVIGFNDTARKSRRWLPDWRQHGWLCVVVQLWSHLYLHGTADDAERSQHFHVRRPRRRVRQHHNLSTMFRAFSTARMAYPA